MKTDTISKHINDLYKGHNATFDIEFNFIATGLYTLVLMLEHCHRNTKSGTWHDALGESYEKLSRIKDDIIEQLMGFFGTSYGSVEIPKLPEYTESLPMIVASNVSVFARNVQGLAERLYIESLNEYCWEIEEISNKLKYKLNMN